MGVAQCKTIYVLPHHREWLLPGVHQQETPLVVNLLEQYVSGYNRLYI
jgi:hypothetical protein